MNKGKEFDAQEYWQSGCCPWTFFAFPTHLADADGFPPDDLAKQLFFELRQRGLRVDVWVNGIAENATYFACLKEKISRLHDALTELENGKFGIDFLSKQTEKLFELGSQQP